jgi:hypothetical protein
VRLVADKALQWFDDNMVADMEQIGASSAEIAAARAQCVPKRFLLGTERDPWDYTNSYPFVVELANETGTPHGIYAGVNPASGEVDIYAIS